MTQSAEDGEDGQRTRRGERRETRQVVVLSPLVGHFRRYWHASRARTNVAPRIPRRLTRDAAVD